MTGEDVDLATPVAEECTHAIRDADEGTLARLAVFSRIRIGNDEKELDGLVTRTVAGEQTLLPIWHELAAADVRSYSPSLADKVALSLESSSIQEMARQIAAVVRGEDETVA